MDNLEERVLSVVIPEVLPAGLILFHAGLHVPDLLSQLVQLFLLGPSDILCALALEVPRIGEVGLILVTALAPVRYPQYPAARNHLRAFDHLVVAGNA